MSQNPDFYAERKFLPNEFAKWAIESTKHHFITTSDTETIYRYLNGVYKPDGDIILKGLIEKKTGGMNIHKRSVNECIGHIQRKTYIDRDEFDNNIDLVNVKNGVLNVKTFDFVKHDPSQYHLTQLPIKYMPDADCPRFKTFLSEILPDKVDRDTIIELFGYCLIKNYSIQKWFMFLGEGANGKGVLLSVLKHFLGAENVSAIELQDLDERFAMTELYGKLANTAGDISSRSLIYSGKLKSLTGGDVVFADRKNAAPIHFVNHAKLIFSANRLPKTFDETRAFWRRVMLITFSETFIDGADDKNLINKLTTEDELAGILNLAIEGLQRLSDNEGFTKNDSIDQINEFYMRNSDSIGTFFIDRVEITNAADDFITLDALHTKFIDFCRANKFPTITKTRFNREIEERFGLMKDKGTNPVTGKRDRGWIGLFVSSIDDETITSSIPFTSGQKGQKGQVSPIRESRSCEKISGGDCPFCPSRPGINLMEFIQMKVVEYGNTEEHAYNVIEALLEKDGVPHEEIEYCIKLHEQGHRIYIPRKED